MRLGPETSGIGQILFPKFVTGGPGNVGEDRRNAGSLESIVTLQIETLATHTDVGRNLVRAHAIKRLLQVLEIGDRDHAQTPLPGHRVGIADLAHAAFRAAVAESELAVGQFRAVGDQHDRGTFQNLRGILPVRVMHDQRVGLVAIEPETDPLLMPRRCQRN